MGIKEELLDLKQKLMGYFQKDNFDVDSKELVGSVCRREVDLNNKIDDFIDWYSQNMILGNYPESMQKKELLKLRCLIEKMAIWYELRYSNSKIDGLFRECKVREKRDDEVMFRYNPYLVRALYQRDTTLTEEASLARSHQELFLRNLEWDKFYNASVFIRSLPPLDKAKFLKPRYQEVVHLDNHVDAVHLHLTRNGFVEISENVEIWTDGVVCDRELKGMHVKNVVELFEKRGISLLEDSEIKRAIRNFDRLVYQREGILNCVMYMIIERGGSQIGPRRGFLFAREFGLNMDIPMMYAIDYSDNYLRNFINEYIKAGGSKNLDCYVDYFCSVNESDILKVVSIQELILTLERTKEEVELYQRLINVLSSRVSKEAVQQEEVRQLRLKRKIEKSMKSKD